MVPLIRSAALVKFAQVAALADVDVAGVFRHVGADLQCMDQPDLRVPEAWLTNALEAVECKAGLRSAGLLVAMAWRMSDFGRLGLLMQHQSTLRDAFRQFDLYRGLRSEPITLEIRETPALAELQLHLRTARMRPHPQVVELALGALMTLLRAFLGADWRPQEVRFAHAEPADLRVHRRLFGCPIVFDSDVDATVLAPEDLDRPNPLADACFSRYAQELVEQQLPRSEGATAANVRRTLELALPQGRGAIAQVGLSLGVSARTLQRRLEEEGTEFSTLVNDVRRGMASRHMRNSTHTVAEVAALVGFSQTSTFSRWFNAQFGKSPTQWRRATRMS